MHSFDLNLDPIEEEDEELSALVSSDVMTSFLQSNQSTEEWSFLPSSMVIDRNERMDLNLPRLDLDSGNGRIDSSMELDESSSSFMRWAYTNNQAPLDLNVTPDEQELLEAYLDALNRYGDEMMVDPLDFDHGFDSWTDIITTFFDDDLNFYWSMPTTVACDVDNLPSVTLTQEELNKSNFICAICMENFCIEEKLKKLPCFHYYHEGCISPWLNTRNTCPTCRYELPVM